MGSDVMEAVRHNTIYILYVSVDFSISLSLLLSLLLSFFLSLSLSVSLSLSLCLSLCLSLTLSLCLSVSVFLSLSLFLSFFLYYNPPFALAGKSVLYSSNKLKLYIFIISSFKLLPIFSTNLFEIHYIFINDSINK